ncbi:MAG: TIGR03618 family F420-dependent PPOX class oxidoreductase [bacterium]
MTRDEAAAFLDKETRGILSTLLPDGNSHPTPVVFAPLNGDIEISSSRDRVKTRNLEKDPRATLCVIPEAFRPYLCVEGRITLVDDPDGQKNLALYRRITGKDPDDTAEYLEAMKKEKRLILRLSMDRLYPLTG